MRWFVGLAAARRAHVVEADVDAKAADLLPDESATAVTYCSNAGQ